jgi:hypothetical protein
MFRDESLGTSHPSSKTHPVLSPSLESDRMQISINNPRYALPYARAYWPICHDSRVGLSTGIQREHPSSREAKSWSKGRYKKQGIFRRRLLWDLGKLRKNPCENKRVA